MMDTSEIESLVQYMGFSQNDKNDFQHFENQTFSQNQNEIKKTLLQKFRKIEN